LHNFDQFLASVDLCVKLTIKEEAEVEAEAEGEGEQGEENGVEGAKDETVMACFKNLKVRGPP